MAVMVYGLTSLGVPVVPLVSSGGQVSVDSELSSAATLADAGAIPSTSKIGAVGMLYNGASLDFQRANIEGTLLASAARTTSTSSADQVNYNGRGVLLILNVTAASGTGGLQVFLQGKDPVSGQYYALNNGPTAVTSLGIKIYMLYPGASNTNGAIVQANSEVLTRTWNAYVGHGDGSSYTYSLGYSLIL